MGSSLSPPLQFMNRKRRSVAVKNPHPTYFSTTNHQLRQHYLKMTSINEEKQALVGTTIIIAGFFGGDDSNLLLFFIFYANIAQRELEVPCRNEVDNVNDIRAVIAFLSAALVALSLIPLPS